MKVKNDKLKNIFWGFWIHLERGIVFFIRLFLLHYFHSPYIVLESHDDELTFNALWQLTV